METFAVSPILLLALAMLALIIFAIVQKKWALLYIPASLVVVSAGLWLFSGVQVNHSRSVVVPPTVQEPYQYQTTPPSGQTTEYTSNTSVKVTRHPSNIEYRQPADKLSLIIMLGSLTLLVLFIVAIVRKKWAFAFIPLGLICVLVLAVVLLRFENAPAPIKQTTQIATTSHIPGKIESDYPDPLPTVWSPGIEKEFVPNQYYSIQSALEGIVARIAKIYRNSNDKPEKIAFITFKDEIEEVHLARALGLLRELIADIEFVPISPGDDTLEPYKDWIKLTVSKEPQHTSTTVHRSGKPSTVEVLSYLGNIRIERYSNSAGHRFAPEFVSFSEQPWLEDLAIFSNKRPGNNYRIAYSQTAASSYEFARAQAEKQAIQIVTRSVEQVARSLAGYDGRPVKYSISREDIDGLIEGQFTQSLKGKASNVYRHAILLNLLPRNVHRLAENKLGIQRQLRRTWAYQILSAVGVALAICIIYLILNVATRGYYTAVLRIMAVIGIIVLAAVILLILA